MALKANHVGNIVILDGDGGAMLEPENGMKAIPAMPAVKREKRRKNVMRRG